MSRVRYCYDCGIPIATDAEACDRCFGSNFDDLLVRPRVDAERRPSIPLPGPWSVLEAWPAGSLVTLTGVPGAGKSTLAGLLRPDPYMTSEQTPGDAVIAIVRAQGEGFEPLNIGATPDRASVEAVLSQTERGLAVLDSLTNTGSWDEQVEVLKACKAWCEGADDRRMLVILQHNKRHVGAGLNAIPHLVSACLDIDNDPEGNRVIGCWKNRNGGTSSRYFHLDGAGISRPDFSCGTYSVEGERGSYHLHPWTAKSTAKWGDMFGALFGKRRGCRGVVIPGYAGAGIYQPGYPRNVLEPRDVDDRRAFAKACGLAWWSERWSNGIPLIDDEEGA